LVVTDCFKFKVRIPPFDWWRTVFFLIPTIAIYTIVLGTVSVASILVDRTGFFAHRCARAWSWLILATTGVDVRASGIEALTPGRTYIFVSNHQSIYDIPILFGTLRYQLRIIAKKSLGRFPFLGWHLQRTGHLLVDRRTPDPRGILRQWTELVSKGLSLIVFPEGTRSPDGRVGRFKAGGFLLAIQAGLPIVPVAISGSRHVMLKNRLMTKPGQVTLVVRPPIETRGRYEPTVEDARRLAGDVRMQIRAIIEGEVGEGAGVWAPRATELGGVPGPPPSGQ
jgi:1-acyl-sn-glycerol-3-phosphate acyltransferase